MEICSCNCNSVIYTTYSVVCTICGVEKPYISTKIQSYSTIPQTHSTIIAPYCRKHRFSCLLRKVIGVDSGPPPSDMVWQVLSQSAPFKSTRCIIDCLKNTDLKNKHYNNLHSFGKAFLTRYIPPETNPCNVQKIMYSLFDEVLFRWNRSSNNQSFFSYSWLMEKLFKIAGLFDNYSTYLKVLICPIRRRKYQSRWDDITKPLPKDSLPFRSDTPLISQDVV